MREVQTRGPSETWSGVRRAGIEGPRTFLFGLVLCICHKVFQWGEVVALEGSSGKGRTLPNSVQVSPE